MSINIENFKLARQWLAEWPDENFDMCYWATRAGLREYGILPTDWRTDVMNHACGTSACLGGVIEAMSGKRPEFFLSLDSAQADKLFFADCNFYGHVDFQLITKNDVLPVLDQIIAAGKWPDEFV